MQLVEFIPFLASVLFFLHISCENLSSFAKYSFAGIGLHMQGISLANILAVFSRGFVAMYGISVAYLIEVGKIDIYKYTFLMTLSLFFGAICSYVLSQISFNKKLKSWPGAFEIGKFLVFNESFPKKIHREIRIKNYLKLFVGLPFVAIVLAYGVCFLFPDRRLLIVSLVPLISMVGTVVTVMFIEPKLATFIDSSYFYGAVISREFMFARFLSFSLAAILLIVLNFLFSIS